MNRILLPIDIGQTEATTRVLDHARKLAKGFDVGFVLLHVLDAIPAFVTAEIPADVLSGHEASAKAKLEELAKLYSLDGKCQYVVLRGRPQHEIVRVAEATGSDVIVIASHQPAASDILLGSVAASVVRHAHCSVMVLR